MRKIFLNRWVFAFIGAALLCVLIWFAGPLIGFGDSHPLDSEIVRFVVMGAVVLLVVILLLFGSLRARKKDEKLIEGAAGVAPPKDDKAQAIDAQRLTQRNKLTEALADMRKARGTAGGGYLYEFPWYVIIGPPGAGKTTALLNSGQRFPLAERHGAQEIKGEGGTRNCDWYFTEKAVIIDTAGRYTTQDSDQSIDQAGWRNFLGLLKETRPSQPLNGVFVVFDVAYLVGRSQDERRGDARAVRTRLIELQEAFGLRLPVYVVFTKLDRIAGFAEFFDDLSREEREQVLGITFPYAEKGPPPHKGFSDAFDRLLTRLKGRLLDRLQAERDLARRNLIFGFPAQFASLRAIVDEMLVEAADESRFAQPLLVRGVYFTSATQQGLPIDRLMGVLSSKFGVSQTQMPAQVGAGRGFFLQRLFEAVVYGEAGLVGANAAVVRRRRLIRRASFAAIALITLGFVGLWTWSYLDNRALIDRVTTRVNDLSPAMTAAVELPYGDGNVVPILPLLNELRDLPTGFADQQAGRSPAVGFGLYQGDRLAAQTAALYRRALYVIFLPRLIVRAQTRLNAQIGDPEPAFQALKTYLMLGDPRRLEAGHVTQWMAGEWGGLPEAERTALAGHLTALLAEPWDPIRLDEPLIAEARERIQRLSPAQRAYNTLAGTTQIRPWRIVDIPEVSRVVARRSPRPLTEGIPGIFTVRCYHNYVLPQLQALLPLVAREAWVFGDAAQQAQSQALQDEVLNLYMQGYIQRWQDLLTDLVFPQVSELRQAANVLLAISASNSAWGRLMRAIARETQLTQPPAPPAQGGQTAGQTALQVAATAGAVGAADRCDAAASVLAQVGRGTLGQISQAATAVGAAGARRVAGAIDPAQAVDDHFRWLIDFASVEGSQLNDFLRIVGNIAQRANTAVNEGGGADVLARLAGELNGQAAAQLHPVVAAMVANLASQTEGVARGAERAELVRDWARDVMPLCERATQRRYPFLRSAGLANETPLDDFARLFAPNVGVIDRFFENRLKRYVDITTRPWRLTQPALGISQATLDQLMRAADIRDAFFPIQGGGALGFVFDAQTAISGTARQTVVEIDGRNLTIEPPAQPNTTFQWPATGGARVVADGEEIVKIDGPWAFLRLFDRSVPQRLGDDRYNVNLAGGVRLQLRARSARNPFSVRQALDQFRCVPL